MYSWTDIHCEFYTTLGLSTNLDIPRISARGRVWSDLLIVITNKYFGHTLAHVRRNSLDLVGSWLVRHEPKKFMGLEFAGLGQI